MARLIAGVATSHAFGIEKLSDWEEKRNRNRQHFADRYGTLPADHPKVALETPEDLETRYARISGAHELIRTRLREQKPDAMVLIADDQDECFTDNNFPQIGIYLGGDFLGRDLDRKGPRHPRKGDRDLAKAIYTTAVDNDIDMSSIASLPETFLKAHAFGPVLNVIDPDNAIPCVPVFINCIHVPAPSAARSYRLGQVIRQAIDAYAGPSQRIAVVASGGMSHYPSSFPPGFHGPSIPFPWGSIDEECDRWCIERMREGDGQALAKLTNFDLMKKGEAELRCWIAALGALGTAKPSHLVYEPFYRGITGLGVGYWNLEEGAS